jgi:WD40 repeat protein
LITGGQDKHIKRISVENRKVDKDFGKVCDITKITRIKITADDEGLLVGNDCGHLKLVSSRDGELIKDFGQAHDDYISGIVRTGDHKFFLTSSRDRKLKQWNYEDNTFLGNHGEIINYIASLCL